MLSILSSRCCLLQSKRPLTLYMVSINTCGHQQCLYTRLLQERLLSALLLLLLRDVVAQTVKVNHSRSKYTYI